MDLNYCGKSTYMRNQLMENLDRKRTNAKDSPRITPLIMCSLAGSSMKKIKPTLLVRFRRKNK